MGQTTETMTQEEQLDSGHQKSSNSVYDYDQINDDLSKSKNTTAASNLANNDPRRSNSTSSDRTEVTNFVEAPNIISSNGGADGCDDKTTTTSTADSDRTESDRTEIDRSGLINVVQQQNKIPEIKINEIKNNNSDSNNNNNNNLEMTVIKHQGGGDNIREIQTKIENSEKQVLHSSDSGDSDKGKSVPPNNNSEKIEEKEKKNENIKENKSEKEEIAGNNIISNSDSGSSDNTDGNISGKRGFSKRFSSDKDDVDPIARLNALKANISNVLKEVKAVLSEHGEPPAEEVENDDEIKPSEESAIRFRFVRRVRKKSAFDEEEGKKVDGERKGDSVENVKVKDEAKNESSLSSIKTSEISSENKLEEKLTAKSDHAKQTDNNIGIQISSTDVKSKSPPKELLKSEKNVEKSPKIVYNKKGDKTDAEKSTAKEKKIIQTAAFIQEKNNKADDEIRRSSLTTIDNSVTDKVLTKTKVKETSTISESLKESQDVKQYEIKVIESSIMEPTKQTEPAQDKISKRDLKVTPSPTPPSKTITEDSVFQVKVVETETNSSTIQNESNNKNHTTSKLKKIPEKEISVTDVEISQEKETKSKTNNNKQQGKSKKVISKVEAEKKTTENSTEKITKVKKAKSEEGVTTKKTKRNSKEISKIDTAQKEKRKSINGTSAKNTKPTNDKKDINNNVKLASTTEKDKDLISSHDIIAVTSKDVVPMAPKDVAPGPSKNVVPVCKKELAPTATVENKSIIPTQAKDSIAAPVKVVATSERKEEVVEVSKKDMTKTETKVSPKESQAQPSVEKPTQKTELKSQSPQKTKDILQSSAEKSSELKQQQQLSTEHKGTKSFAPEEISNTKNISQVQKQPQVLIKSETATTIKSIEKIVPPSEKGETKLKENAETSAQNKIISSPKEPTNSNQNKVAPISALQKVLATTNLKLAPEPLRSPTNIEKAVFNQQVLPPLDILSSNITSTSPSKVVEAENLHQLDSPPTKSASPTKSSSPVKCSSSIPISSGPPKAVQIEKTPQLGFSTSKSRSPTPTTKLNSSPAEIEKLKTINTQQIVSVSPPKGLFTNATRTSPLPSEVEKFKNVPDAQTPPSKSTPVNTARANPSPGEVDSKNKVDNRKAPIPKVNDVTNSKNSLSTEKIEKLELQKNKQINSQLQSQSPSQAAISQETEVISDVKITQNQQIENVSVIPQDDVKPKAEKRLNKVKLPLKIESNKMGAVAKKPTLTLLPSSTKAVQLVPSKIEHVPLTKAKQISVKDVSTPPKGQAVLSSESNESPHEEESIKKEEMTRTPEEAVTPEKNEKQDEESENKIDQQREETIEAKVPGKKRKMKKKVVIRRIRRRLSTDGPLLLGRQDSLESAEPEICEKEIETKPASELQVDEPEEPIAEEEKVPSGPKSCLKLREYQAGDLVLYNERIKKNVTKWKKATVLDRITSISYKLNVEGEEKPCHVCYIKKYTDKKVRFGGKEYLEIDYAQEDSEEEEEEYNIWARV